MSPIQYLRVGFLGCGNLAQAMIKRLIESKALPSEKIWASNRTPGKLIKLKDSYGINVANTNEELIDNSDIIILATKPQDLISAIEPLASLFNDSQIIMSLAAGVTTKTLRKQLPTGKIVRIMPNTPSVIGRGVIGYCLAEGVNGGTPAMVEDFLKPFGFVVDATEGDEFDTLTVSCASGTGFVFELMSYWQEWIEERGFDPETARKMTIETFLGASMLAVESGEIPIVDLQSKVVSKKGVTSAGLDSMRELELERGLRLSFEKAWMRNQDLGR